MKTKMWLSQVVDHLLNWFHSENTKEEIKTINSTQGVVVGMKTVPVDPSTISNSIKTSAKPGKTSQVSQLEHNPIYSESGISFVPTKRVVSPTTKEKEEEHTVSPQDEAEYLAMLIKLKSLSGNAPQAS